MRKFILGTVVIAALIFTACAPDDPGLVFPEAHYLDQAFTLVVTDDSAPQQGFVREGTQVAAVHQENLDWTVVNYNTAQLILDFEGDGGYANGLEPTYIYDIPTIDGVLSPSEDWHREDGFAKWYTVQLSQPSYSADGVVSSGDVSAVDIAPCYNMEGGKGVLYIALQWLDPGGAEDKYHYRFRVYADHDDDTVSDNWLEKVFQVVNGDDPHWPTFFGESYTNDGYNSDTVGFIWDAWGDANNDGVFKPSVDGFWENGWDLVWGGGTPEMTGAMAATDDSGPSDTHVIQTPKLDVWWWDASITNWHGTAVNSWAEDFWMTGDSSEYNGMSYDTGKPIYVHNERYLRFPDTEWYPIIWFHHQDQKDDSTSGEPQGLHYPNNPDWIDQTKIQYATLPPNHAFDSPNGWKHWTALDEVPGVAYKAAPLGSGGSVTARGTFDEGTGIWTLELQRPFNTDQPDDANLEQFKE